MKLSEGGDYMARFNGERGPYATAHLFDPSLPTIEVRDMKPHPIF
jgi:hypothetical protein